MSRAAEAEVFERDPMAIVDALVRRGRVAMDAFADSDQARVDEAVTAIAWSLYKPAHAETLAAMAVEDTGLGNAADKVLKNQRKTFGTLRDLMRVKSVGIIEEQPALGLVKYAKPVGVVCAVTPSTNPAATPVNKTMMALKGRNAIVIAPSPGGLATTTHAVALMRTELQKIGALADLVQVLPTPVDKAITHALMAACDLVVVTGSQSNVRAAYRSGTPAIGVGAGNVPVIIDSSAMLDEAAAKISASKCFDNATSCSSENALIIVDDVYDDAVAALQRAGGYLASAAEKDAIQRTLWVDGKLNRSEGSSDDAEQQTRRRRLSVAWSSESCSRLAPNEAGWTRRCLAHWARSSLGRRGPAETPRPTTRLRSSSSPRSGQGAKLNLTWRSTMASRLPAGAMRCATQGLRASPPLPPRYTTTGDANLPPRYTTTGDANFEPATFRS